MPLYQNIGSNSIITAEVPTGLINSSNTVYTAAHGYIAGTLEVYINGVYQRRTTDFTETTPGSGTFTMAVAPVTGQVVTICYQFNLNPSSNADTVDGYHGNDLSPVGSLVMYAGASAPNANWLICNGAAVSRTTYATLFTAISTAYGAGDGSTTFNIPDLRGRSPIGAGTGTASGATAQTLGSQPTTGSGGEQTHTMTTGELVNHNHSLTVFNSGVGGGGAPISSNNTSAAGAQTTGSTGSTTPFNILQPMSVVNFIIRAA